MLWRELSEFKMANNLYNAIRIAHRSPTAILNLLVESYGRDYTTFATGNNCGPLEEAVKILTGSKLDKALGLAISKGYEAGGLTTGYIGSVSGKYAAQLADVREKYDDAIERATAAFRVALTDSGLFAEKEEKSKEEKQKAKEEREAKKAELEAETKKAIISAAVVAGEVVRSEDVVAGALLGDAALIDTVCDRITAKTMANDNVSMLFSVLLAHADRDTLDGVLLGMGYAPAKKATVKKAKADTVTA